MHNYPTIAGNYKFIEIILPLLLLQFIALHTAQFAPIGFKVCATVESHVDILNAGCPLLYILHTLHMIIVIMCNVYNI